MPRWVFLLAAIFGIIDLMLPKPGLMPNWLVAVFAILNLLIVMFGDFKEK